MIIDTKEDIQRYIDDDDLRSALIIKMRTSFFWFFFVTYTYLTTRKPSIYPFTKVVIQDLQDIKDGKLKKHYVLEAPPSSGKTTLMTYFIAWLYFTNPNYAMMFLTHSQQLSNARSGDIKAMFTQTLTASYISFFYKLTGFKLKHDRKASTNFQFQGAEAGTGFFAKTYQGGVTGANAGNLNLQGFNGGVWIDDPMKADDINSQAEIENLQMKFANEIKPRLRHGFNSYALVILTAQPLGVGDLGDFIQKNDVKGEFFFRRIPVMQDDELTCCDKWDREFCERPREGIEWFTFQNQYMCNRVALGGEFFKEDWFKYYDGFASNQILKRVFITCDPARGVKEKNDFSVMCVWATDNQRLYLLEMRRGKWLFADLKKEAINLWNEYKQTPIGYHNTIVSMFYIEKDGTGDLFYQDLHNTHINIQAVQRRQGKQARLINSPKDKYEHAQAVQDYIISGKVFLPSWRPDITRPFITECLSFTGEKDKHEHDDIVDNLIDAVDIGLIRPNLNPFF